MKLRAYTLIEVIIAMVIVSILLLGAIGLVRSYSMAFQWDRLFLDLEQEFFDANAYALAGVATNHADDEDPLVSMLPGMRHLYFAKGDVSNLLYLETIEIGSKRKVIFSRLMKLDQSDVIVSKIEFFDGTVSLGETDYLLMTWSSPLAELTFQGLQEDIFDAEVLSGQVSFPLQVADDRRSVKITFQDQRGDERGEFFDLQKGVERDFY